MKLGTVAVVEVRKERSPRGAGSSLLEAVGVALSLVLGAPSAAAQFDQFDWTLEGVLPGGSGGSGSYTAEQMSVNAGFDDPSGHWVAFVTTAPVDAHVSATGWLFPHDGVCLTKAAYVVNGSATVASTECWVETTVDFDVQAGDSFGFGILTISPTWPGIAYWSDFKFLPTPPYWWWADLAGGAAGTAGVPQLSGEGLPAPLMDVTLTLTNGKPSGSATLVIGLSALQTPFKGGVLVPSPDLLVPGLPLNAAGALVLVREWPAGIPPGFALYLQYWIADAAGAQGFAASNGLSVTAL